MRVFKFKGFHDKGGEVGWGFRAKICHGPRATLIRPWSLSVVLVVLMPIAKDRKRAPITPPVGELHLLSEIWGPRANYTFGAPVNHNYPPPSVDKFFIPLQICICPAGGAGKLLPMPPSLMGGPISFPEPAILGKE